MNGVLSNAMTKNYKGSYVNAKFSDITPETYDLAEL